MKFLKNSKLTRSLLAVLLVFGISFATLSCADAITSKRGITLASNKPVFNSSSLDYSLIRVAKVPAAGSDFSTSITAVDGDTLAVMLYYHNNTLDSTAYNTSLKVALDSNQSTSHVLSASLWADNANTVTGGAEIKTSEKSTIEYVSGSTLWYPNRNQNPSAAGIVTPDGITNKGVNIHDVKGCWQYAGFVSFKVKVKKVSSTVTEPETKTEVVVTQTQTIEGVTSLPKTGSPFATFAALSAVLAGLVVSGYYYFVSRKRLTKVYNK